MARIALTPAAAAWRWVAALTLAASLVALAAIPGAAGLAAAAAMWAAGFGMYEWGGRKTA